MYRACSHNKKAFLHCVRFQIICQAASLYTDMTHKRLLETGFYAEVNNDDGPPFQITDQVY